MAVALITMSACSGTNVLPLAPEPVTDSPPVVTRSVPTPVLPVPFERGTAPPVAIYEFLDAPVRVQSYTAGSRIELGADGTFRLVYPHGSYRGTYAYSEASGVITFLWEGWSVAGAWGAIGSYRDGVLSLQYNVIMQLDDFEDARYVAAPP